MRAEIDIRFVSIANSSEMGGSMNTTTFVAWLEKGIAILRIESHYSEDEIVPSAEVSLIGMDGEIRELRTVRFDDDENLEGSVDTLVIASDDLYEANEHGDRYEALMTIAVRLVREDAAGK